MTGGFPPLIGAALTATPGVPGDSMDWATCDPNGTPTPLATGAMTYTLASTDAGHDVCAVEMDPTGTVVMGVSDPVGPVGSGPSLNEAGATVTQTQTLTVTQGAWGAGASPPTDAWYDCDASGVNCAAVASGATGTSYMATRADVGSTIEVKETANAPGGTPGPPEWTQPTKVVIATPPVVQSSPTVSGTAQVGDTLTAGPGSWSNQPTDYSYQWDRCSSGTCTPIPGATSKTYVPVNADLGDALIVSVAAAIDPGTAYGAASSPPYPFSYPTSPVVGIASSPQPNPGGPSSPAPSPPVAPIPPGQHSQKPNVVGRLTATMRWTFRYAPSYTQILALVVDGPALGSRIETRCSGRGCPVRRVHRITVRRSKHCSKTTHRCRLPRSVNLEWEFRRHRLGVGARVTIRISRAQDIGKYYRFVVRPRRAPSVMISCLAPGSVMPGKRCTGL